MPSSPFCAFSSIMFDITTIDTSKYYGSLMLISCVVSVPEVSIHTCVFLESFKWSNRFGLQLIQYPPKLRRLLHTKPLKMSRPFFNDSLYIRSLIRNICSLIYKQYVTLVYCMCMCNATTYCVLKR